MVYQWNGNEPRDTIVMYETEFALSREVAFPMRYQPFFPSPI